jgi:recombination protein RecR
MSFYAAPIAKLVDELSKLPGVGNKTAQRLAFYILKMSSGDVEQLANAITNAKKNIKQCKVCCNITDSEVCSICANTRRDSSIICVVEDPKDVRF